MATHDAGIVDQMRKRVIELERRPASSATRRTASTASSTDADHGHDPDVPTKRASSMQLRYVFSELGSGLRRNLSMHLAVILTLFVSLTLVGIGVLLNQQADKAAEHWGSQLQITVFLCSRPATPTRPAPARSPTAQKAAIQKVVDANPEVATYHYESKQEAFDKLKEQSTRGQVRRPELRRSPPPTCRSRSGSR